MKGGANSSISIIQIGSPKIEEDSDFYILIVDCGGETTIPSYIRDQRKSLIKKGYLIIYGLLDVRPNWARDQIPQLEKFLYFRLPQKEIETVFILSVMEIEAWFLAEDKHYHKIHPNLNIDTIRKINFFDPLSNTELIDEPAILLNNIYQNVGLSYHKNKKKISRTVNNLDYENLYFHVVKRNRSFETLINSIHKFI